MQFVELLAARLPKLRLAAGQSAKLKQSVLNRPTATGSN